MFNGEIFNYVELREELGRSGFQTSCDTEVLLEAVARWGVEKTLDRLNGMFAFALWDGRKRELTLARDRVEKSRWYMRRRPGGSCSRAS